MPKSSYNGTSKPHINYGSVKLNPSTNHSRSAVRHAKNDTAEKKKIHCQSAKDDSKRLLLEKEIEALEGSITQIDIGIQRYNSIKNILQREKDIHENKISHYKSTLELQWRDSKYDCYTSRYNSDIAEHQRELDQTLAELERKKSQRQELEKEYKERKKAYNSLVTHLRSKTEAAILDRWNQKLSDKKTEIKQLERKCEGYKKIISFIESRAVSEIFDSALTKEMPDEVKLIDKLNKELANVEDKVSELSKERSSKLELISMKKSELNSVAPYIYFGLATVLGVLTVVFMLKRSKSQQCDASFRAQPRRRTATPLYNRNNSSGSNVAEAFSDDSEISDTPCLRKKGKQV